MGFLFNIVVDPDSEAQGQASKLYGIKISWFGGWNKYNQKNVKVKNQKRHLLLL